MPLAEATMASLTAWRFSAMSNVFSSALAGIPDGSMKPEIRSAEFSAELRAGPATGMNEAMLLKIPKMALKGDMVGFS